MALGTGGLAEPEETACRLYWPVSQSLEVLLWPGFLPLFAAVFVHYKRPTQYCLVLPRAEQRETQESWYESFLIWEKRDKPSASP